MGEPITLLSLKCFVLIYVLKITEYTILYISGSTLVSLTILILLGDKQHASKDMKEIYDIWSWKNL